MGLYGTDGIEMNRFLGGQATSPRFTFRDKNQNSLKSQGVFIMETI